MSRILIVFSTVDGQTKKICARLARQLEEEGNEVELLAVDDASDAKLRTADKIVVGASIRYGKHNKKVYAFVAEHEKELERKKSVFFSVNVVARKPNRNTADTNPYLKRFLKQISWKPTKVAVFAGKIDYQRYGLFDRSMIRFIMWLTKGPTDPKASIEFTDWEKVAAFGKTVNEM